MGFCTETGEWVQFNSTQMSNKKQLNVLQDTSNAVDGVTCFSMQAKYKVDCQRKGCRSWIDHPESQNCSIIAAFEGPKTLQDVGKIFGLTRMRICQIEKNISKKIKDLY